MNTHEGPPTDTGYRERWTLSRNETGPEMAKFLLRTLQYATPLAAFTGHDWRVGVGNDGEQLITDIVVNCLNCGNL